MRVGARWSAALLSAVLLVYPSTSRAAHPELEAAKAELNRGAFREALLHLEKAERSPALTEEELVEVNWHKGVIALGMGRQADAEKAFDKVLALRPLYTPNRLETPPDIRQFFDGRAKLYARQHGVQFSPELTLKGASLELVLLGNIKSVDVVQVFVRPKGALTYQRFVEKGRVPRVAVKLGETALWKQAADAGAFEVVLEAQRANGTPLARVGDALTPAAVPVDAAAAERAIKELNPPPPEPPPAAKEPAKPAAPVATKPAEQPATPAEPQKQQVIVLRPTEPAPSPSIVVPAPTQQPQSTAPIVVPAPTPPAPAPVVAPLPEEEGSGMAGGVMRAIAGVGLVGGGVLVGVGVLLLVGAGVAWGSFAYTHQVLSAVGADFLRDRETWILAWQASWIVGSVLVPAAGVAAVAGISTLALGVAALVRSLLM